MKKSVVLILILFIVSSFSLASCGGFDFSEIVTDVKPEVCEHIFSDWQTEREAKCEAEGLRVRVCTKCGHEEEELIPASGHEMTILREVKPTCTEAGLTEGKKCSTCGEILVKQEEIPALNHKEEIIPAVEPNCTETGLAEGKKCSTCGEILVKQEEIKANGHNMGDWHIIVNSEGEREFSRVCAACDFAEFMSLEEKFSQLSYVSFGDSITYGIDGVDWGLMADPYPNMLTEILGFKSLSNQAVSGATFCQNTLNRCNMTQKILNFKGEADIISLMLGVNDFYVNLPLGTPESRDNTTIYGSLYLISEYLTENYKDSFIFYMTPFPARRGYTKNSQGYYLADVANAIKHVAAEYNIPVLDMYSVSEYENVEMNNSNSDGVHPSQSFMRNYATPKMVAFIKKNYGKAEN